MTSVVTFADDGWTDLGPTPIVIELAGEQEVAYLISATVPPNTLVNSRRLLSGQRMFLGGTGKRVYARPSQPNSSQKSATVKRGTLAEFYSPPALEDRPAAVDLNDPAARAIGLVGLDIATGLPVGAGGVVTPPASTPGQISTDLSDPNSIGPRV